MKYRIVWEKGGTKHQITVGTKAEMLAEVDDKVIISDKVCVSVIERTDRRKSWETEQ
jgi:hypothetical protein